MIASFVSVLALWCGAGNILVEPGDGSRLCFLWIGQVTELSPSKHSGKVREEADISSCLARRVSESEARYIILEYL